MALGQHYLGQTYLGGSGAIPNSALGSVTATFAATLSSETVTVALGLTATFATGYNPEAVGENGVVAGAFIASGAGRPCIALDLDRFARANRLAGNRGDTPIDTRACGHARGPQCGRGVTDPEGLAHG